MAGTPDQSITAFGEYELLQSPQAFIEAAGVMAARVEKDGLSTVLSYRFFVNAETRRAGVVIVYGDAETWIRHHQMIAGWPEFQAFRATARMDSYTLFGPVNDTIREMGSKAAFPTTYFPQQAAGFVR